MGFFFIAAKAEQAARPKTQKSVNRRDIPITALNQLGCSVCPRDKDTSLVTPKMPPSGAQHPLLYLLLPAPSLDDDTAGDWLAKGNVSKALLGELPKGFDGKVRFGGVIQCATSDLLINQHEMECCRGRVVSDIERSKPKVIVGVGDAPLGWATELPRHAPTFRGTLMSVCVGTHECLYYPINYPNFALKDTKSGNEHALLFRNDIAEILALLASGVLPAPEYQGGPYDADIACITGSAAGDYGRVERALADLVGIHRTGLDLETNMLRPWGVDPLILTAAVGTFENTVAFALDHPEAGWSAVQKKNLWCLFTEYLLWSGIKECHNLAFEMEWLGHRLDERLLRMTAWDDTMSMAHTLDERPGTKSLEVQTVMHYGFNLKAQSRVDPSRILEYPLPDVLRYNGMDTKWTNRLSRTLRSRIAADPKYQAEHDRKVRLAPTLVMTESKGLPLDLPYARTMEEDLEVEAAAILLRIGRCAEVIRYKEQFGTFSPTNPDHVLRLMDKVCKRPEVRKKNRDSTSSLTTDEEALKSIPFGEVPSAGMVLEHRSVEKLLSTYIRPMTTLRLVSADGRIHSKYSSMVAVTGRLAGEDPNCQNWPKRKHKKVRGAVTAGQRRWLLACDYGQIEFRVVGMAGEDPHLVKCCWTGYDVHKHWAERIVAVYGPIKDWVVAVLGVDWDEIGLKALRQETKNKWVFPQLFGASTESCARNLMLPDHIAKELGGEFWDNFAVTRKWQKRVLAFYARNLYVETLGGRRRRGAMSANEIINMPIQGTAADIVTAAMDALSERSVIDELPDIQPILNVHDDLTFEPADTTLEQTLEIVVREMCLPRFSYINVPLVVEASLGQRWSDLKEIGVYRSDVLFGTPNPYK